MLVASYKHVMVMDPHKHVLVIDPHGHVMVMDPPWTHGAGGPPPTCEDARRPAPSPAPHLGVPQEAGQAEEDVAPQAEVLRRVDVGHVGDVCVGGEGRPTPPVDQGPPGAAADHQGRPPPQLQELQVGVTVPRPEGLVGVEAPPPPPEEGAGAPLGAVGHPEVPVTSEAGAGHRVGTSQAPAAQGLQTDEAAAGATGAAPDGRASAELGHHHHQGPAQLQRVTGHRRGACGDEDMGGGRR